MKNRIVLMLIILLMLNGCAGTGLNKKCTMMPDEIWIQNEVGPTGINRDYKEIKVVGGAKWKLQ